MDTRKIDEKEREVTFDLLKVWASEATGCEVGVTSPLGCGWQSLASALRCARRERLRDEAAVRQAQANCAHFGIEQPGPANLKLAAGAAEDAEEPSERSLKLRLLETYCAKSGDDLMQLMEAKIADPLSYFSTYPGLEEALKHWVWYLHCLTFQVADFTNGTADLSAVCMPLDMVDLQVLGLSYSAQIVVRRLMEEAQCIAPPENDAVGSDSGKPWQRVQLLCHCGLWAPLLGPLPPEMEVRPLIDAIVELGDLPEELAAMNGKAAVIKGYDRNNESYTACVDLLCFAVERDHMKRVLYRDRELVDHDSHTAAWRHGGRRGDPEGEGGMEGETTLRRGLSGPAAGEGPCFRGIPDGALEFQLLHELVRRSARVRLERMMQELAGRTEPGTSAMAAPYSIFRDAGGMQNPPLPTPTPLRNEAVRQQPQAAPAPAQDQPLDSQTVPEHDAVAVPVRRDLREAERWMDAGQTLIVVSPSEWQPDSPGQLPLDIGIQVRIRRHTETGWVLGSRSEGPGGAEGWCPKDQLTFWEVHTAWAPDATWLNCESYLALEVGDLLMVTKRYTGAWQDWGYGICWGKADGGEGVFHLSHATPKLLVSRGPEG